MKTRRGLLVLGLPLIAGLSLVIAAASLRRPAGLDGPPPRKSAGAAPAAPTASKAAAKEKPKPVSPEAMTRAAEEARIRGSYQNYRTAVATGNGSLQRALEKTLLRDREAALRFAREEAARAQTPRDREIAARTLEALGR